jgi:hypothetical protein
MVVFVGNGTRFGIEFIPCGPINGLGKTRQGVTTHVAIFIRYQCVGIFSFFLDPLAATVSTLNAEFTLKDALAGSIGDTRVE